MEEAYCLSPQERQERQRAGEWLPTSTLSWWVRKDRQGGSRADEEKQAGAGTLTVGACSVPLGLQEKQPQHQG